MAPDGVVDSGQPPRAVVSLAVLIALGVVLHRVEAVLPLPSPWIRLGLANVPSLLALVFLGVREAFTVTLLRVLIASLLAGTILGPTFWLSLAGGMGATAVMAGAHVWGGRWFSLVGVSVAGAYAHTGIVFACVFFLFIRQNAFAGLLPFFLMLSLGAGVLTGIVANAIRDKILLENLALR